MFYCNRKTLKGGVTVHLDVTKSRFDLLRKANKYVKIFLVLILNTLILTAVSMSDLRIEGKSFSMQWRT